jgi:large conductance mechanosensitive channel
MNIIKEFKEFISRGNVIDLAVGVIIGAAFGKIVSSIVNDLVMPLIGILIGGVNFSYLKIVLKDPVMGPDGNVIKEAVSLNIGNFIQTGIDFVIIAAAIFILIKIINSLRKEEQNTPPPPAPPTKEEELLTEIRDLLKNKK